MPSHRLITVVQLMIDDYFIASPLCLSIRTDKTAAKVLLVFLCFSSLLAFELRVPIINSFRSSSSQPLTSFVSVALQRITVIQLLYEVGVATLQGLLISPVISVIVATLFLMIDTIIEAFITKNDQFMNAPIYYCVLYLPFSSIYFITKKKLRNKLLYTKLLSWKGHQGLMSCLGKKSSVSIGNMETVR